MTSELRIGILGAGWAGASHAAAFSRLSNVTVTALWSRTRARADELAGRLQQPGLQVYDHWQDVIEHGDVDVISVATSPLLRREPVEMALARGRHLLVEKPMSVGVVDAQAIVAAAGAARTVTASCFNWRYAPAYQVAWRAVREGQIGTLRDVRTEWRFRATKRNFFAARPWLARMDIANGALGEGLSHDFDKARFLTGGEFTRMVSRITPVTIKQDGDYRLDGGRSAHLAELTGGVLGGFYLTPTAGQDEWRLTLIGDEGTLLIADAGQHITRQRADDDQPIALEIPEDDQSPAGLELIQHAWNRLIADFVAAIRQGDVSHQSVPHLPSLIDGLRIEEIIAAARASDAAGCWVTVRPESE